MRGFWKRIRGSEAGGPDHLTCQELVELVTAYLEGGLEDDVRERFEEHVIVCVGCANYLEQIQMTIELSGRVTVEDLSDDTKATLLAAFRGWERV